MCIDGAPSDALRRKRARATIDESARPISAVDCSARRADAAHSGVLRQQ